MSWEDILKKQFKFKDVKFEPHSFREGYTSRTTVAPNLDLSIIAGDGMGSIPQGKLKDPHSYKAYEIAFIDMGEDDTPFVTADLFGGEGPDGDIMYRQPPKRIEQLVELAIERFKAIKQNPTSSMVQGVKQRDFEEGFSRDFQDKYAMES
jgi:hypothetical protein|tara:strand:- start:225 stop:674 length:450 start_codon:yes stop_codon:yes gene_type:complete